MSAFEKKHSLNKTWLESDRGFVAARSRLHEKQRAVMLGKLVSSSRKNVSSRNEEEICTVQLL